MFKWLINNLKKQNKLNIVKCIFCNSKMESYNSGNTYYCLRDKCENVNVTMHYALSSEVIVDFCVDTDNNTYSVYYKNNQLLIEDEVGVICHITLEHPFSPIITPDNFEKKLSSLKTFS